MRELTALPHITSQTRKILHPKSGIVSGVFDLLLEDRDLAVRFKNQLLSSLHSRTRRNSRSTIVLLPCYHGAIGRTAGMAYADSDPK